jgi:hypothetical protein
MTWDLIKWPLSQTLSGRKGTPKRCTFLLISLATYLEYIHPKFVCSKMAPCLYTCVSDQFDDLIEWLPEPTWLQECGQWSAAWRSHHTACTPTLGLQIWNLRMQASMNGSASGQTHPHKNLHYTCCYIPDFSKRRHLGEASKSTIHSFRTRLALCTHKSKGCLCLSCTLFQDSLIMWGPSFRTGPLWELQAFPLQFLKPSHTWSVTMTWESNHQAVQWQGFM